MKDRLAVGEVEAAYILGAADFATARRLLRTVPTVPGTKLYRVVDIQQRAGIDERASLDLDKAGAALKAAAQAASCAPRRHGD